MPRTKTPTWANFRFDAETLAALDKIVAAKEAETGLPTNRTAILRLLIRQELERVAVAAPTGRRR